jgi:uncharacterized protein (TIGR00251 family)
MFLHLKAKPNARQNSLQRLADGTLQVRIKAPAQDGKANEEIVKFLSEFFDLPKSAIRVVTGHGAPFKKIEVNAEDGYVRKKLEQV